MNKGRTKRVIIYNSARRTMVRDKQLHTDANVVIENKMSY